jgi:DMSO/TMAO reductase YedYZ molybdopterin-dependent catalytic subunit
MAVITERCTDGIAKPLPPEWFIRRDTSAEMRWEAMQGQGYFVPTERCFVRNHTSTPLVDPLSYELEIHGRGLRGGVGGSVFFSYDQLTSLPSVERTVAIECAGNGRSLSGSQQGMQVPGTAWGLGAIGVTRWRGVPLSRCSSVPASATMRST